MKQLSRKNIIYLNSEALKHINYNERKHILEATFNNNRTYHYKAVPQKIWDEFIQIIKAGESAGAFINQNIKPYYDCVEVI